MSVLIKFIDGEELIIHNVVDYSTNNESANWKVEVEGICLYFNKSYVKYIGHLKFLKEEGNI